MDRLVRHSEIFLYNGVWNTEQYMTPGPAVQFQYQSGAIGYAELADANGPNTSRRGDPCWTLLDLVADYNFTQEVDHSEGFNGLPTAASIVAGTSVPAGTTVIYQRNLYERATTSAMEAVWTPSSWHVIGGVTPINAAPAAAYTLARQDIGGVVNMASASAQTFTIPSDDQVAFYNGGSVEVFRSGAGTCTIVGSQVTAKTNDSYGTLAQANAISGSGVTLDQTLVDGPIPGAGVSRMLVGTDGSTGTMFFNITGGLSTYAAIDPLLVPGASVPFTVGYFWRTNALGHLGSFNVQAYNAGTFDHTCSASNSQTTVLANGWNYTVATYQLGAATTNNFHFIRQFNGTSVAGDYFDTSNFILFQMGTNIGAQYFNGDSPNCTWNGATGASKSSFGSTQLVYPASVIPSNPLAPLVTDINGSASLMKLSTNKWLVRGSIS